MLVLYLEPQRSLYLGYCRWGLLLPLLDAVGLSLPPAQVGATASHGSVSRVGGEWRRQGFVDGVTFEEVCCQDCDDANYNYSSRCVALSGKQGLSSLLLWTAQRTHSSRLVLKIYHLLPHCHFFRMQFHNLSCCILKSKLPGCRLVVLPDKKECIDCHRFYQGTLEQHQGHCSKNTVLLKLVW